jgi:hypothetical protein
MAKAQTKSKQRVADHGEVFTAEREVDAMLDLVKQETERIDSRFLEPACGDGNFLAEILRRKLAVVKSRYGKNADDWERYAVIAVTSIYGVELLSDNCTECKARLYKVWDDEYITACKKDVSDDCRTAVKYILEKNILCGDALTLKRADGEPIIFAEWSAVNGCKVKRRDFRLDELLEGNTDYLQPSLFDNKSQWEYDAETKTFIPCPIKEYAPVHYRRVQDNG